MLKSVSEISLTPFNLKTSTANSTVGGDMSNYRLPLRAMPLNFNSQGKDNRRVLVPANRHIKTPLAPRVFRPNPVLGSSLSTPSLRANIFSNDQLTVDDIGALDLTVKKAKTETDEKQCNSNSHLCEGSYGQSPILARRVNVSLSSTISSHLISSVNKSEDYSKEDEVTANDTAIKTEIVKNSTSRPAFPGLPRPQAQDQSNVVRLVPVSRASPNFGYVKEERLNERTTSPIVSYSDTNSHSGLKLISEVASQATSRYTPSPARTTFADSNPTISYTPYMKDRILPYPSLTSLRYGPSTPRSPLRTGPIKGTWHSPMYVTPSPKERAGSLSPPGSDESSLSDSSPPSGVSFNRLNCQHCNRRYATLAGLTRHQQNCTPGKCYSCPTCNKSYTSCGALKMHIRTHTLPCKCHICGKSFSRPWLLQGHIRTHTGEKPYQCTECHRSFADRSNLRAHQQTHATVKKYACGVCYKTFSRMSLLTKHEVQGCGNPQSSYNSLSLAPQIGPPIEC